MRACRVRDCKPVAKPGAREEAGLPWKRSRIIEAALRLQLANASLTSAGARMRRLPLRGALPARRSAAEGRRRVGRGDRRGISRDEASVEPKRARAQRVGTAEACRPPVFLRWGDAGELRYLGCPGRAEASLEERIHRSPRRTEVGRRTNDGREVAWHVLRSGPGLPSLSPGRLILQHAKSGISLSSSSTSPFPPDNPSLSLHHLSARISRLCFSPAPAILSLFQLAPPSLTQVARDRHLNPQHNLQTPSPAV